MDTFILGLLPNLLDNQLLLVLFQILSINLFIYMRSFIYIVCFSIQLEVKTSYNLE